MFFAIIETNRQRSTGAAEVESGTCSLKYSLEPVAHNGDLVAQKVHHALVGDGHSEIVCLFLKLVEPRQVGAIDFAAGRDFVLQESQFTV